MRPSAVVSNVSSAPCLSLRAALNGFYDKRIRLGDSQGRHCGDVYVGDVTLRYVTLDSFCGEDFEMHGLW